MMRCSESSLKRQKDQERKPDDLMGGGVVLGLRTEGKLFLFPGIRLRSRGI